MRAGTGGRLTGKVALITGGAGSIGLATAQAFVAEGAQVMIVDLVAADLERAAETLGVQASAWSTADVTSSDQVLSAVSATVERFGRLDVAFANAGIFGIVAPVAEYPLDVFERVIAVNVIGSFLTAKHALAVMQPGGSLIINSSVVGLTSDRGHQRLRDVEACRGRADEDGRQGGGAARHSRQLAPSRAD